ncbi:MAG: AAA family ATPase [Actinomycetota bacterium]|nr:AAA family ATPase [Actinomycetota bacterium]
MTQEAAGVGAVTPERYQAAAHAVEAEVRKMIVGQDKLIREAMVCLLAEGHALIEGVPGLGKTMLLRTLADALDLEFSRIQFTPDLMPADIVGTQIFKEDEEGRRRFEFAQGPLFANLTLADEVNRATPKTQSALLEAMQERAATVAGETRPMPRPFFVMATQNPIEMEGTYPLPEAQLDRFLLKILVEPPEPADLVSILERTTTGYEPNVERVLDAATLRRMIALTREVPVATHLGRYVATLVAATNPQRPEAPPIIRRYARFGSSPRGAQALVLGAKVSALLDGRLNVAEEDVVAVARPALRHRLILSYEALADGVAPDALVDAVLDHVPSPVKEVEALG